MEVVIFIPSADAIWRDSGRNHVHGWANVKINVVVWSRVRALKAVEAKRDRWTNAKILMSVTHGLKEAELMLCYSRPLLLLVVCMWGKTALFYKTRYIGKLCYNATLCRRHLFNKTHDILKRLVFPCFLRNKTGNQGCMTSLAGDLKCLFLWI